MYYVVVAIAGLFGSRRGRRAAARRAPTTPHLLLAPRADPWFKARHKKRRVVQPELVASIARNLPEGGWLFTQTDVLELAEDIRDTIADVPTLRGAAPVARLPLSHLTHARACRRPRTLTHIVSAHSRPHHRHHHAFQT